MASNLRVDSIVPATGTNVAIGTVGGGVNIPGVLTYEDVTNVDSVGVITARSGVHISGSGSDLTMNSAGTIFTGNGGNATNPAVVNVSDTNTGYFYPAADTIAVTTGGSERLPIASDGAITAQKSATFGNTSDSFTAVQITSSTSGISELRFADTTVNVGYVKYQHSSNALIFATNSTEKINISSDGYLTKPQTPFFSVYGTGNNQTYNQGTDISFENAKENVGNHFKMTSGTGQYQRFIAPVAGVYIFTFGMFPNAASNCRISLTVNGAVQTNPYISGCFSAWGTGVSVPMGSQMLKLSANDYVDVRITSGTLTNTYDGHTGFQGYLLG